MIQTKSWSVQCVCSLGRMRAMKDFAVSKRRILLVYAVKSLPSNGRMLHGPQARSPRGSGTPTGRGGVDRRRRLALRPRGCRCTRAFWRVKPPRSALPPSLRPKASNFPRTRSRETRRSQSSSFTAALVRVIDSTAATCAGRHSI